jgi:CubicO group peptidase (beta-lactamase class C family)
MTPERLGDWAWMIEGIAALHPLFEPGSRGAYQCLSQGWMLGEIVRRSDPDRRSYRQFVIDEIAVPLQAPDLHHGIPDGIDARIATLDEPDKTHYWAADSLFRRAVPEAVDLGPGVWERADVRRATVPSTGGIFTARSAARFWAMLAEKGELDGARILQRDTVERFLEPLPFAHESDPVILMPYIPLGRGGIWLGAEFQPAAPARNARTLVKPGYGHSIGIADLDNRLAVAICHNRLFNPHTIEQCHNTPIVDAVRRSLNLPF